MTKLGVDIADSVPDEDLARYDLAAPLWKCAMESRDKDVFSGVKGLFKQIDASLLGGSAQFAAKYFTIASSEEHRLALASIIRTRLQWLSAEISRRTRSSTWEMPDACFPADADIKAFLHGPKPTFVINGFTNVDAAGNFIDQNDPSESDQAYGAPFTMTVHETGSCAIVILTKTQRAQSKVLISLEAERKYLSTVPITNVALFG
ncbi:unnamed protein product [Phytophthora lilii]|uniref:Unnamed protein product n=1 Tax=Phytophthora lilii TaxID=2077276 RepID=A0A9W6TK87_9STRA|nr:unnamed protein product [Phytophthora lilii]